MSEYAHAPGTVRLFADDGELIQSHVELVPKPSMDPEDPLNWSKNRKRFFLGCLLLYTAASTLTSSSLFAVYGPFSEAIGLSLDDVNSGNGYAYWAIGFSAVVTLPLSLAFGKRPVFVAGAFAASLINIWTVFLNGKAAWIVSRLILGFAGGPSFCLVEVAITDVYFLHERSLPMGLYVFVLYAAALLSPLIAGFIYDGMGLNAVIWMATGFYFISAVVLFFCLEETNFTRDEPTVTLDVDPEVNRHTAAESSEITGDEKSKDIPDVFQEVRVEPVVGKWRGPRFWKFLTVSPFAKGIMKRGVIQPFAMMRLPIVLWCGFMYGIYQIYFNFFGALSAGVLAAPPYNFSNGIVGLTFIGPLIAAIPGAIWGGWLCDKFTLRQAKKYNGVSEPEHKLKLFIIPTITTPIGLLMMGLGPYYGAHWIVYVIGESLNNLGGPVATLLILSYAFDCFHSIDPEDSRGAKAAAQDCAPYITAIIFIGMCVTFALGYAITPWSFGWSFKYFGISAACISLVINVSVIFMLMYGKGMRQSGEAYYRKIINW